MTYIDIGNRALAVIGHDRIIQNQQDTSREHVLVARFYPSARNNVLASYNWDFASIEASVSVSGASTEWTIPAGFVRLVSVRDANGNVMKATRKQNKIVIANPSGENGTATVRYVGFGSGFEDTMPHLVVEAVVYELASLMFGPLIGNVQDSNGTALFQSYVQLAGSKLQAAISAETSEHAFMGGNRSEEDDKKTEVANRALAKLGGATVVTDYVTDPSPVAARIRLFFASSVDRVLRLKDWDFAAVEVTTALTAADESGYARYQMPSDAVRISKVTDTARHPLETVRNRDCLMIRTEGDTALVRYVTRDIALAEAPDDFVDLLAAELACRLAPTVVGDAKAAQAVVGQLRMQMGEVDMKEANETAFGGEWRNPFIAARG